MLKLLKDRNLQITCAVMLMILIGVSGITPAIPSLMIAFDIAPQSIGLLLSMLIFPGVIIAPLVGVLADRTGRKRILTLSLIVFGLAGPLCSLAPDYETLLFLRVIQGVGLSPLGVLTPTIMGDLYDGASRTQAMALGTVILGAGSACFPIVGGFLAEAGWRYPFLMPLVALPLAGLVHKYLDNPEPREPGAFGSYVKDTFSFALTRQGIGLLLITLLTSLILFGCYSTYMPVLLAARFDISPALIGLLMSISSVFTSLASIEVGRLVMRVRESFVLTISFLLHLVSMLSIPLMPHAWGMAAPIAMFGAAMGINVPIRISLLAGLAPKENRAGVVALNAVVLRAGQAFAPILMGLVMASSGLNAVFWVGALVALGMLATALWLID